MGAIGILDIGLKVAQLLPGVINSAVGIASLLNASSEAVKTAQASDSGLVDPEAWKALLAVEHDLQARQNDQADEAAAEIAHREGRG